MFDRAIRSNSIIAIRNLPERARPSFRQGFYGRETRDAGPVGTCQWNTKDVLNDDDYGEGLKSMPGKTRFLNRRGNRDGTLGAGSRLTGLRNPRRGAVAARLGPTTTLTPVLANADQTQRRRPIRKFAPDPQIADWNFPNRPESPQLPELSRSLRILGRDYLK